VKDIVFVEETHEYFVDGRRVPCVSDILSSMGFVNTARFAPVHAERGKIVHELTRLHDLDILAEESVDSRLKGYLEGYKTFKRDFGDRLVVVGIEEIVYNEQHGYAGTLDRWGYLDGDAILYDIKSGVEIPWHVLQTTAYALCMTEKPKRMFGLYVRDDGTYKLVEHKDPSAKNAWIGAVVAHRWKAKNGAGR